MNDAATSKAWPFEEARKVVARLSALGRTEAVFETGFGPSGLPHVGTFAEVVRTGMVIRAFREITGGTVPVRLIAFSDDMDGLRKVPENLPNQAMLDASLGLPLTSVPDPFGTHPSFAAHNNARLRGFLDAHGGLDYEFMSATDTYRSGRFDAALLRVLERYDEILDIILPTLGADRRATYSPFMPISPETGRVLQAVVVDRDATSLAYRDPDTGRTVRTPVTGGACKLQWKADWAMRWVALGVDYEMSGKDLIDSVRLSTRIAKALGGAPPENLTYELFLDKDGEKVSKSRGNGLSVEEWLEFGNRDSLAFYMFQKPREARRLHREVIPRAVDDHLAALSRFPGQDLPSRLGNPAWHVHAGTPPAPVPAGITFSMLLNLAAVANSRDPKVLWGFIGQRHPDVAPGVLPLLDELVGKAMDYYVGVLEPAKRHREADEVEREALSALADALAALPEDAGPDEAQAAVYDAARGFPRYRDHDAKGATPERPGVKAAWFNAIYEICLGQSTGPRFGSFVALYGVERTRALIRQALGGELVSDEPVEELRAPGP